MTEKFNVFFLKIKFEVLKPISLILLSKSGIIY